MSFKIKKLKNFLFSLRKRKIKNINIDSNQLKLSINTAIKKSLYSTKYYKQNTNQADEIKAKNISTKKIKSNQQKDQEQSIYFTIVSPMIGTFYRSPAPNEDPFIAINDSVKAKQTVCIIEAMKLMNEIESEVDGSIAEILVEDGDIVDCGQALMRVKEK